jgi:hypothetical protein
MTSIIDKEFDVLKELEKTVLQNLVQSFGLDFILLEDKRGGDVDTIHNVRKWQRENDLQNKDILKVREKKQDDINVSKEMKKSMVMTSEGLRNKEPYKKEVVNSNGNVVKQDDYHNNSSKYRERKDKDKKLEQDGKLTDGYTKEILDSNDIKKQGANTVSELDHSIPTSEIHHDAGRILSGVNGVELANSDTNLISTHQYFNNIKSNHSLDKLFSEVLPKKISENQALIETSKKKLKEKNLSQEEKNNISNEINNLKRKNAILEKARNNELEIRKTEEKARKIYNEKINKTYYASSKFLKNTAFQAGKKGLEMGGRQALGVVISEIWFELKEQIPTIYHQCKNNFKFEVFLAQIKITLENIFKRIKERFHGLLVTFKDGMLGGIISSIHTTVINIFSTSTKMLGKLIREMWNNLVKASKLAFFNPDNLNTGDLVREIIKLLSFGLATTIGTIVNSHLNTFLTIPFGNEIATFLSGLVSGVLMLGFTYFLEHSEVMNKVWDYLNSFKTRYEKMIEHMKEINLELDRYLIELSKLEFNLNTDELSRFSTSLSQTNNELERKVLLIQEIEKRGINLDYDPKQTDGFKHHLVQIQKEYHGS